MGKTELFMMLLMAGWGIVSAIIQKRAKAAKAKKAQELGQFGVKSVPRASGATRTARGAGRRIPAGTSTSVTSLQENASSRPTVQAVDVHTGSDVGKRAGRGAASKPADQLRAARAEERLAELRRRSTPQRPRRAPQTPQAPAQSSPPRTTGAELLPGLEPAIAGLGTTIPSIAGTTAPMRRAKTRHAAAGMSIRALLHDPASLRNAIVLREILDRPVSERPSAMHLG